MENGLQIYCGRKWLCRVSDYITDTKIRRELALAFVAESFPKEVRALGNLATVESSRKLRAYYVSDAKNATSTGYNKARDIRLDYNDQLLE